MPAKYLPQPLPQRSHVPPPFLGSYLDLTLGRNANAIFRNPKRDLRRLLFFFVFQRYVQKGIPRPARPIAVPLARVQLSPSNRIGKVNTRAETLTEHVHTQIVDPRKRFAYSRGVIRAPAQDKNARTREAPLRPPTTVENRVH